MNDDILEALPNNLKQSASAILLVGSFSDRLESITSDIDLFVILKSGLSVYSEKNLPFSINGLKLEISFFTTSQVNACLGNSRNDFKSTSLRALEIIYKLFSSTPLQQSSEYLEISRGFDCEDFKIRIIQFYLRQSNGYYDDSVGHYLGGNWLSTAIAMQSYLNTFVDAWLAHVGDMYPKPQHRIAKAIRQMVPERLDVYSKILLPDAARIRDDLDSYCGNVSRFTRQLQAEIFLSKDYYLAIKDQLNSSLKVADWIYIYERGGEYYAKNKKRVYKISRLAYIITLAVSLAEQKQNHILSENQSMNIELNKEQIRHHLLDLISSGILTT